MFSLTLDFEAKSTQTNFKEMFKEKLTLIFWILCAFELATSRPAKEDSKNATKAALIYAPNAASLHPDVELIDLPGVRQPDEDAYRRAAAANGMDPTIVAEVVRTRKPVVKTEYDTNGAKKTTTYKLEADGSISRHTLTEYMPTIENVHRTQVVTSPGTTNSKPKAGDWEWNPTNVPKFGTPTTHNFDFPQYTPTWRTPVFTNEGPFASPRTQSGDGTTTVQLPDSWNPRLWPNTYEYIDPTSSGTQTKTVINDDGSKVTTTHTVGPTKWTTRTYTYPGVNNPPPKFDIQTTTPFPSLQDFLKTQYGTTTIVPGAVPVTTISIDDLPTVRVPLNEIKPSENLPPLHQTTTKTYTKTITTQGDPTAADLDPNMREILRQAGITPDELFKSKNGTVTRTRQEPDGRIVTTTYRVRTVPSDEGIVAPNFAKPTYTSTFDLDKPRGPFFIVEPTTTRTPPHISSSHGTEHYSPTASAPPGGNSHHSWQPTTFDARPRNGVKPAVAQPGATTKTNSIEEFLSKINLNPSTIQSSNGEVIKTIVDDKGRVLTASFVLSTVKNNETSSDKTKAKQDPIK